jgi:NAD(P)-dependent dehydrogenase (short-subunit alcohol dehydrogenase family)
VRIHGVYLVSTLASSPDERKIRKMSAIRSLEGRRALVTGAASGIGKATALELARGGARVVLADIDTEGVRATAEAVRRLGRNGHDVSVHTVDLSKKEDVEALAARVLEDGGPVDILVNNAGVAVVAPFLRTTEVDWEWLLSVNLWGPMRLTRALLPAMIERGTGHVVMVASLAGLIGAPGLVAYGTTKFALVGLTEALRLEIADAGVGVTLVCPGFVRTNFAKASRYDNDDFRRFLDEPPSWYGMPKERVAARLVEAVLEGRPLVVLGPEKVGWWLKRIVPEAAFNLTRWAAKRAGIGLGAAYEERIGGP